MFGDTISAFQRWNYRGGRPSLTARVSNQISAIAFAAGIGPSHAATLEVRGHKSGRRISFPVVIADYEAVGTWWRCSGQKRSGRTPVLPIDRHAPVSAFERIVDGYPVFRVV
jgi:hypothetical protein